MSFWAIVFIAIGQAVMGAALFAAGMEYERERQRDQRGELRP